MRFAFSEKQDKNRALVLCNPLAISLLGRLTRKLVRPTIILAKCLPAVRSVGMVRREVCRYVFLILVLVLLTHVLIG